ncbi:MAG: DUF1330 domain-containing protein [Geminicoccaceae bacterium]
MIARITVKDPEKFKQYLAKTQQVAASYGAELLYRGKVDRALNGSDDHALAVIAKFPSVEKLNAWYDSDAYQPLKALRDAGTDMQMTSYELEA